MGKLRLRLFKKLVRGQTGSIWQSWMLSLVLSDWMAGTTVNYATRTEGKWWRRDFVCASGSWEARSSMVGWSHRFESQPQNVGHLNHGKRRHLWWRGERRWGQSWRCPHVGGRRWRIGLLESKWRPGEVNIKNTKWAENFKKSSNASERSDMMEN